MQLAQRTRPLCPVAHTFVATWETGLGDMDRRRIVAPLRARLGGTRTAAGTAAQKAATACDWLVRTCAPTWLEMTEADPSLLAALRSCPSLTVDSDTRQGRIAVDRAIQSVVGARMLACNIAWQRSRPPSETLGADATAIAERLLPLATAAVFGRTGFEAALAAADRAPFTNRWSTLRDHLHGLAQAAVSTLVWDAVWATVAARESGTWTMAAQRRLDRDVSTLIAQLQPHAISLGQRMCAP
jgi:hypothetical protein